MRRQMDGGCGIRPVKYHAGRRIERLAHIEMEERLKSRAFHQPSPDERIERVGERRHPARRRACIDPGMENLDRARMDNGSTRNSVEHKTRTPCRPRCTRAHPDAPRPT